LAAQHHGFHVAQGDPLLIAPRRAPASPVHWPPASCRSREPRPPVSRRPRVVLDLQHPAASAASISPGAPASDSSTPRQPRRCPQYSPSVSRISFRSGLCRSSSMRGARRAGNGNVVGDEYDQRIRNSDSCNKPRWRRTLHHACRVSVERLPRRGQRNT